jgi:glycosyltransferase involved in cell wall biosynthesis
MMGPAEPFVSANAKPSILFVHDGFPGQFGPIAVWLAQQGWTVWFATGAGRSRTVNRLPGVRVIHFAAHRAPSPQTHPYAQPHDRAALKGQACARACLAAQPALGPELVMTHMGPGAGLYLSDVFPWARHIAYGEWWYNTPGVDVAYLAGLDGIPLGTGPEEAIIESSRNIPIMAELLSAGMGLCPTAFQAAQFPEPLRALFRVEHDGVDCQRYSPGPPGRVAQPELARLAPEDRVITYATRGMEPHRGFPQVMEAIARVQAADRRAHAVIAGENRVYYGGDALRRTDWKERALERSGMDPSRVTFTGTLSPQDYLWMLRRSDAHVYATVPFVLSWSMLDAMACATPLVLSDTAPVREFADTDCALLADREAPERMATAILATLEDPTAARARGRAARARIEATCAQSVVFPSKARWLRDLA